MDQKLLLATAFKMTVALGVVLLVFGGAIMLVRRFAGNSQGFLKRMGKGAAKPLEVLAYQSLGPGRGLYLVRCLDKKVLVGATNSSIQHLSDIVEDEDDENENMSFGTTLSEKVVDEPAKGIKSQILSNIRDIARV